MAEIKAQFPTVLTLHPMEFEAVQRETTGTPSTVVKWTGTGWKILRQGGVQLQP
jgi:L-threonylcarbamoyladenylate synthase